jgi:hypothetical protein
MDVNFRFTNCLGTYIVQFKDVSHLAKSPIESLPYPYEIIFDPYEHNFNYPVHAKEILPLIEKIRNTKVPMIASSPQLLDAGYYELAIFEGDSNATYRWGSHLEPGWEPLEAIADDVIRLSRIANPKAFPNIPVEAPDEADAEDKE